MKENKSNIRKYEKWTEDEYQFLRQNVDSMPTPQIARALNRSCVSVTSKLYALKINRVNYNSWTIEEEEFIRNNYHMLTSAQIASALNRRKLLVKNKIYSMGLRLPATIVQQRKVNGQFKKGGTPFNKGLKGVHYSPASEFKKGHLPGNTKYDGCITIRTDHYNRRAKKYKWIRLSLGKWELLHRVIWQQAYGKIPKRKILYFKNGDTLDCRLENLMLLTRKEQVLLNGKNRVRIMKEYTAAGFTDRQIAGRLAWNNPQLRKELLKHPEILELHRINLKLKKELKDATAN